MSAEVCWQLQDYNLWSFEVPIAVLWHLECSFVVQSLSRVQLFATPWTSTSLVSVSFPVSRSLPKLTLVIPNNHFILSCPFYCPQSFSASGSFLMSQFLTTGDQVIGALALASVLPINIQSWFPLGLTGWSPSYPRDSQEFSPLPQFESISSSGFSLLYGPTGTVANIFSSIGIRDILIRSSFYASLLLTILCHLSKVIYYCLFP